MKVINIPITIEHLQEHFVQLPSKIEETKLQNMIRNETEGVVQVNPRPSLNADSFLTIRYLVLLYHQFGVPRHTYTTETLLIQDKHTYLYIFLKFKFSKKKSLYLDCFFKMAEVYWTDLSAIL